MTYFVTYFVTCNLQCFCSFAICSVFAKFSTDTKRAISFNLQLASSVSINNDKLLESAINILSRFGDSYIFNMGFQQSSFNSSINFLESVEDDVLDEGINHYIFSNTSGWENRYSISFEKYLCNFSEGSNLSNTILKFRPLYLFINLLKLVLKIEGWELS